MSIWLFRAGSKGEYEEKFLSEGRVYLTWNDLEIDLNEYEERESLFEQVEEIYSGEKTKDRKSVV